MTNYFEEVSDFHQLLRHIRRRYQMWVGDDICEFKGFLTGFGCAKKSVSLAALYDFIEFVAAKTSEPRDVRGGSSMIAKTVTHSMSAIPKFFYFYEEFSDTKSIEMKVVTMTFDQKVAFTRLGRLGFARNNMPPPDSISIRTSEFWGDHLVFEHKVAGILYELSVESVSAADELIAKYQTC